MFSPLHIAMTNQSTVQKQLFHQSSHPENMEYSMVKMFNPKN